MLSKYRAILFDFDDTLVNTVGPKWTHHKEVARRFYNHEITNETLTKYYGLPYDEMIKGIYPVEDTLENIRENIWTLKDEFPKTLKDGALELLSALIQGDKTVGIVTATSRRAMDFDLPRLRFPVQEIAFVQTAEDTDFHKPDPRVFDPTITLLDREGITRDEIVYIGDALRDFHAANGAKIDFIGVTHGQGTAKEFGELGITHVPSLRNFL